MFPCLAHGVAGFPVHGYIPPPGMMEGLPFKQPWATREGDGGWWGQGAHMGVGDDALKERLPPCFAPPLPWT